MSAGHGAPGNAMRGQGGSCLRVVFSSASPSPTSGASNGFGISAVHFLEGVNYLVDEHICQQAEAAASMRARGSRLPVGPTRACSLLFRGRLAPLVTPRMGTSRRLLGLSPGFLCWPGWLPSKPWVPPLEGSLAS